MADTIDLDLPEPVPPPEIAEEEELHQELLSEIPEARQQDILSMIASDCDTAILDRSDWEKGLNDDQEQYYGILPEKNFPWPGCSNFSVPLTMLGVETLKPRLVGAVMGGDPPVFVRGVGGEDAKRAEIAERFLNWQIRSQMALEEKVYESAHLFLIPGTIVAKTRWTQNRRRSKSVRKFPADTPLETMFQDIFGVAIPENLKQRRGSALDWEGDLTEGGETKPVRLKLRVLEREIQVLVEKEEILYDGPEVELLPAEDFLVPFQGGADVQKLPWCTHRYWLWEHELRRKVEIGAFDREAVDELIRLRHSPSPEEESAAQQTLSTMEGVTPDAGSNVKAEQYEIREHYRRIDIDDDGAEEEVVIWASPEQPRRFLGWDYLDNVYAHGRRPFRIGRYAIIPFRFHGLSFAKVIQGIQEEINAIHNQRNDLGTIRNSMTYFYRASMALPPQGRVRPGEGVPVDSTQDILVPQWGGSEAIGQAEEALLYQYFERLTGLTDLALGRQPNRVGATRTATGVASLLSEAGLRFKTSMEAFQRFWVGIFEDILALDQQYLPPETEFRVTGKIPTAIRIRDRREIMGKYNLILSATTETMNRAILRENVAIRFQTMLNPALIGSGLVDVKLLRKTFREFLKEHGEADPDSLLPAEANQMPRTPEEELAMWVSGDEPQPTPLENLSLHIDVHSRQIQDPVVVSTLGPDGIKKIQAHLAQTVQLAQAQSIAAMLQPQNGRPMASPTGKQGANAITGMAAPQGMTPTQRGGGTPPLLPGGTP